MKLVLLGTGGYFPTAKRQTACLMLPEVGIVLDAGTGMYRLGRNLRTNRLDIFLTHAHLDHIAGLTYLINLVQKDVLSGTTVHGEAEKLDAIREHLFATEIFPVPPAFRFQPLCDKTPLPQGGTLTFFSLSHPGGSLGYRLDWPHSSLAYVTDTTAVAGANYIERIRGVDVLVHEAYFADDDDNLPEITGHSSLPNVVELAVEAGVERLILTHIDPQIENDNVFDLATARSKFQNVMLGYDGLEVEF
jgi:ribonuclease BN (tRNA processing enzyme)